MITTLHEETAYWSFEGGLIRCRIELSMGLFWGTKFIVHETVPWCNSAQPLPKHTRDLKMSIKRFSPRSGDFLIVNWKLFIVNLMMAVGDYFFDYFFL